MGTFIQQYDLAVCEDFNKRIKIACHKFAVAACNSSISETCTDEDIETVVLSVFDKIAGVKYDELA